MKTVFFDIDSQIDFVYPAGALYVPGAELIVPVIAELNRRAPLVISTMDAHSEDDPEFHLYPHHCVVCTTGQQKPSVTLREKRAVIPARLDGLQQLIVEKQKLDCFTNPNLMPLLAELNADRYVVYGVVTEICVRLAAFGLLKTGKRVDLVTDAVKALDELAAKKMFDEFTASGGRLTVSDAILGADV
ncbi:MAG TPA: isochorismatase family protein [Bryobacteraceae bacterium]|nr:isochorismatase family protein [Bryobacteraceae bacterium]